MAGPDVKGGRVMFSVSVGLSRCRVLQGLVLVLSVAAALLSVGPPPFCGGSRACGAAWRLVAQRDVEDSG